MLNATKTSIKKRLVLATVVTSIIAVSLACLAFATYELIMFRRSMRQDLVTLADITGSNSTATLTFDDRKAASETLSALSAVPHIISACVYGRDNRIFAAYTRTGGETLQCPDTPRAEGYSFGTDHLEIFRQIRLDGEVIGTVYLRSDLTVFYARLKRYAGILIFLIIASSLIALALSSRIQRPISEPILRLAETAKIVSSKKNYSIRAQKQSQDEVGALTDAFNDMLAQIELRTAQLEAANQELEAFSYSVSHDLRAPLRTIDGFSKALLNGYMHAIDPQGRHYLERVRAGSQRMEQLIEDLLNLARVARGSLRRVTVDLSALAQTIATELQRAQPERNVTFNIAPGLKARGDPHLLQIVLENLLHNAWKFTGKHPQASIEVGQTHNNGKPAFYVRDDGAGFDMAYSEKLFGAFQRLHGRNEFEGTGIGLATVQRVIHRHGGRVWVEGEVEKGACFYFSL